MSLLLAACRTDEERAVLRTVYDLAMRAGELAEFRAEAVDLRKRTVAAKRLKNGPTHALGIGERTAEALRQVMPDSGPVFPRWSARRFERWFRALVARAGLPSLPGRPHNVRDKGYSHILRRSRATHLVEDGEEIKSVQRRLGHKSAKTTMLYLGLTEMQKQRSDEVAARGVDAL